MKDISKIEIKGDVLQVVSTIDEHKYIKCDLENICKYLDSSYFTEHLGFMISSKGFPYYVQELFLTKQVTNEYKLKITIQFQYNIMSNWSVGFFGRNFANNFSEGINNGILNVEIYEGDLFCNVVINIIIKDFQSVYDAINIYMRKIKTTYNTTKQLDNYVDRIACNTYNIPIDESLKTALKQYLIYFPEYVRKAKGEKIRFEVTSDDEFLSIHISKDMNFEVISNYLMEYVGFIKKSISNLNPEIRNNDLSDTDKNLLLIELKSEIRHLQTSLEIKNVEKNYY